MPDSYWRGPLAFIVLGLFLSSVIAVLIWDYSAVSTEQSVRNDESSRRYSAQANERIEARCSVELSPAAMRSCIIEEIESASDQQRSERDLDAQESVARSTRAMMLASWIAIFLGGGSAYLIWATLRETQRMAHDAREIGEAQARAYLSLDVVSFFLNETGATKAKAVFECRTSNTGNSPAFAVRILYDISVVKRGEIIGIMNDGSEFYNSGMAVSTVSAGGFVNNTLTRTMDMDCLKVSSGDERVRLSYVLCYTDVFKTEQKMPVVSGSIINRGEGKYIFASDRVEDFVPDDA